MSVIYKITRNIEASVVDYLTPLLAADNWNCRVELDFGEAYKDPMPCIVIDADDNPDKRLEVGGNTLTHTFILELRIFATGNGQRKDLRDWLLEKIMLGVPYYTHTITNNVAAKVLAGRLSIGKITANRKELANSEKQSKYDRYRHILSFNIRVALN